METRYRFVDALQPEFVGLKLFRDSQGNPKSEVSGPLQRAGKTGVDRCIVDPDTAIMVATRIANCNDVEVVVLGDPTLWQDSWGTLIINQH